MRSHYNDVLAVEMEGRGFLEAARTNDHIQALIIRTISDLLDGRDTYDSQGSQEVATSHAAAFAFEILAQDAVDNFFAKGSQRSPDKTNMNFKGKELRFCIYG